MFKPISKTIVAVGLLMSSIAIAGTARHVNPTGPRFFYEQSTAPSAVSDFGVTYTKDSSGITELFYKDSAGTETQLTSAGSVSVPNPITFSTSAAITAGSYQIGRDADATNQLHFNVPTGAAIELSVNDVAKAVFSSTKMALSAASVNWASGVAITASQYEIARDTDATNQLHFNVPTGATFEFSANDISHLTLTPYTLGSATDYGNTFTANVTWGASVADKAFVFNASPGGTSNHTADTLFEVLNAGVVRFSVHPDINNNSILNQSGMLVSSGSQTFTIKHNGNGAGSLVMQPILGGSFQITPTAGTSGAPNSLVVTGPAHTGITASTEAIGADFNFSATKTWAAGLVALQREIIFRAPTYATATFTKAATVTITGAPSGTVTNALAFSVEAGASQFDGAVIKKQGSAIASASTIVIPRNGNTFELTGTTAVTLITSTGYQDGHTIRLIANENVTITHGTATSGSNLTIKLAGAGNFAMTADDSLTLVLSTTTAGGQAWREVGRTAI